MERKLIFVYNQDSGFINGVFESLHKVIKPSTYACSLCALTHNHIGMRKTWSSFLSDLPIECEFYHRDEFLSNFSSFASIQFPCVFIQNEAKLIVLIDSKEINESSHESLKNCIHEHLKKIEKIRI